MGMITSRHKQTKKSYLANAIAAFVIAIIMIVCAVMKEDLDADYIKGTAVGVGIMLLMGIYWVRKHLNFDEDSKRKSIMDKLGL